VATGSVHNRREALATTSRAVTRYDRGSDEAMRLFGAALHLGLVQAEAALASRRTRLAQAQRELANADEDHVAACRRRVEEAERLARIAEDSVRVIRGGEDRFRGQARRFRSEVDQTALRGQAVLRTLDTQLDAYLASSQATSGLAESAAGPGFSSQGSITASPLEAALAAMGLESIDVNSVDFSDNPITSWSVDASIEDVAWAVERWDSVVARVVARGGSQEELQARDERAGVLGTRRRLAGVWDTFLRDPIVLSRARDGSVTVGLVTSIEGSGMTTPRSRRASNAPSHSLPKWMLWWVAPSGSLPFTPASHTAHDGE